MQDSDDVTLVQLTRISPEEVWNTKAQSGVIVSYLQRYHVPPIVLRMFMHPAYGTPPMIYTPLKGENEDMYECIDGKQRLTSLRR